MTDQTDKIHMLHCESTMCRVSTQDICVLATRDPHGVGPSLGRDEPFMPATIGVYHVHSANHD